MSLFARKKLDKTATEEEPKTEQEEADVLMRQTLETVEQGLRVKREAREKAARFVGSLRPVGFKQSRVIDYRFRG